MKTKTVFLCLLTWFCATAPGCAFWSQASAGKSHPHIAAKVTRISEEFANINTDLSETVLATHGIAVGQRFTAKYKGRTIQALLGKDYGDVPKGDWIALIEEDDNLQLAISFGHAATELGCTVGDTLFIAVPQDIHSPSDR